MNNTYVRALIYYIVNAGISALLIIISNASESDQITLHLFGGVYHQYSYSYYILGWIYFLSGLIIACGSSLSLLTILHKQQDLNSIRSKRIIGDLIAAVFSILIGVGILEKLV